MTMDLRKIDALVAEKVMGWLSLNGCLYPPGAFSDHVVVDIMVLVPRYSTSIAAAWEVVEKLTGEEFQVFITASDFETFVQVQRDGALCERGAAKAPLAICLAALTAVGVKLEPQGDGDAD